MEIKEHACPVCGENARPDVYELADYRLFLCPACGLRFAPDAFDKNPDYEDIYESPEYEAAQVNAMENATDYKMFADHPTYMPFFKRVRPGSDSTLLDVGCGVGRFCHAAADRGFDVKGIDISSRAIETGRKYADFPLEKAGIETIAADKQVFNVITAFEVIEHLHEPLEFLALAKRALEQGGSFFCTVPNWDCRDVRESSRKDWLPPVHVCFYTQSALGRLGRSAGFAKVKTGLIYTDPMPAGFLPKARWIARRILRRPRKPSGLWMLCTNQD